MRTSALALLAAVWTAGMAFAEEGLFQKRATWAESMTATRAAVLASQDGERVFEPVESGLLRGGDAPERLVADVSGLDRLRLVVDVGPDNYNYDQAVWGEPTLFAADGSKTRLTELEPASVSVGWGNLIRDRDHVNKPLRVGGKTFEFGYWAHAPSALEFALDGRYVRFETWAGIGAAAGKNGSSVFHVLDRSGESLWRAVERHFPDEAAWMAADAKGKHLAWFGKRADSTLLERVLLKRVAHDLGCGGARFAKAAQALEDAEVPGTDPRWLSLYAEAAARRAHVTAVRGALARLDLAALRRAVEDLAAAFPRRYPGAAMLERLAVCEQQAPALREAVENGEEVDLAGIEALLAFRREALLANPLLDFERMLIVQRSERGSALGLPANWQGNCVLPRTGYDDALAWLDVRSGELEPFWRPEAPRFVGDVDLHFDADRLLFSMLGSHDCWQIWEIGIDGGGLRQVTPGEEPDVDNYDACYLPDGRIIFGSTAPMRGVPCVDGSTYVANLFIMNPDGSGMRQLCFDQEHNWCPTVLNNGRVMYLRWEYTDTPHSQTRLLFHMNPDGTGQMEYCGSNSYWPNGTFYARAVPDHPTRVAGIVTGHHGVRRMGELLLFDPAQGRHEAEGAVQRIPGWGKKVEPIIRDQLVNDSWPKFLHPYPLSSTYFLTACKPTPDARWGIYLADVFDNLVLIKELAGYALFEPTPVKTRPTPPIIADKVVPGAKDATVYMADVYKGGGLAGIPRGTVKALRVFTYHYGYRNMGGLLGVIGMDGPWDIKRVMGTVPVEEDGSALFSVPANTPVAVQPLDAEGKALQRMRSWFTAMPGEVLSCVGCHEKQNEGPPVRHTLAARKAPAAIAPWHGPTRGFSFVREVQPVLDHYCVGCHNGSERADGRCIPDLRGGRPLTDWRSVTPGQGGRLGGQFTQSYAALHKYIRRPGIESDYHLLTPMEFHADTTELVQMLAQGHHGVQLCEEAWDRLITWIDLNVPFHGYWHEIEGEKALKVAARQVTLSKRYADVDVDPEYVPEVAAPVFPPAKRVEQAEARARAHVPGWPFGWEEARERQASAGGVTSAADGADGAAARKTLELGGGVTLELALIPAGEFVMDGAAAAVDAPFWLGVCEVSNRQFARYDPDHDSRVESKHAYQFGVHGFPVNEPEQPAVRLSWDEATGFCAWLSERMGEVFALPTQAQWEWACRAGADTPFSYGDLDADFSGHANLADAKLREFADNPYEVYSPLKNPTPYDDWIPKDTRFNDGTLVSAPVGRYAANAWGLHDMHGNVWEWTADDAPESAKKVARGGSWYDRPKRATASSRLHYYTYQRVFNVGFRVCGPAGGEALKQLAAR